MDFEEDSVAKVAMLLVMELERLHDSEDVRLRNCGWQSTEDHISLSILAERRRQFNTDRFFHQLSPPHMTQKLLLTKSWPYLYGTLVKDCLWLDFCLVRMTVREDVIE